MHGLYDIADIAHIHNPETGVYRLTISLQYHNDERQHTELDAHGFASDTISQSDAGMP